MKESAPTQLDILGIMQRSLGAEGVRPGRLRLEVGSIVDEDDFSFDSQCFCLASVFVPGQLMRIAYLDLEASD
jgi:hypothetical protein